VVAITLLAFAYRVTESQTSHNGMSHNAFAKHTRRADPPGTLDGSKNPELISDSKAYEVLFQSAAIPDQYGELEKSRTKEKFRRANLSEADANSLIKVLTEFHGKRVEISARASLLRQNKAPDRDFMQLQADMANLVSSTQQQLSSRLSSDGAEKLHQYVIGIKTKIKILPPLQK
jgi:hypothetical protein